VAIGALLLFTVVVAVSGAFMRLKNPEVWKLGVATLGPYVTLAGFLFVLEQLRNTTEQVRIAADSLDLSRRQNETAQVWKTNEFLAGEMKYFFEDAAAKDVLHMIDYSGRSIFYKEHPDADSLKQLIVFHSDEPLDVQEQDGVSQVHLGYALRFHRFRDPITPQETAIRDRFDRLSHVPRPLSRRRPERARHIG